MRGRESGLTMVEMMVSLLLVSIAAAFIFAIQSRTSQVLRDQSAIAETQQTLRVATEQVVRDLRQSGYLAQEARKSTSNGDATHGSGGKCVPDGSNLLALGPVSVTNNSDAPDILNLQYADTDFTAHILSKGPSFHSSETAVDNTENIHEGDVLFAVHTRDPLLGHGCLIQVTGVSTNAKIQHNPGASNTVNAPSNCQCDGIEAVWDDGYTVFTKIALRAYRIKPDDTRGILQLSNQGGADGSWIDLAVGIVDLQLAIRVYQPHDNVNDTDGDGDPQRDWYSGEEMETILGDDPDNVLLQISVTLVAKTEVHGVEIDQTPDLIEQGKEAAYRSFNRVGDRSGTDLPVTDVSSMYYGENIYRSFTATVDLRNIGVGN